MKRPPVQVGSPRECRSENLGHSPGVGLTCGRSNHPLVKIIFFSFSNTFQPLMILFSWQQYRAIRSPRRVDQQAAVGHFSVLGTMHDAYTLPIAKCLFTLVGPVYSKLRHYRRILRLTSKIRPFFINRIRSNSAKFNSEGLVTKSHNGIKFVCNYMHFEYRWVGNTQWN